MNKRKAHKQAIFFADVIAIVHFVSLNVLLLIGKFTEIFNWVGGYYPEIEFVLNYVNYPVYVVAKNLIALPLQYTLALGYVEVVMVISSLLYALAGYVFARLVLWPLSD